MFCPSCSFHVCIVHLCDDVYGYDGHDGSEDGHDDHDFDQRESLFETARGRCPGQAGTGGGGKTGHHDLLVGSATHRGFGVRQLPISEAWEG